MDNFGDIIYFLVLIVIAVAGMFGKKNKAAKKGAAQEKAETTDTPNPWEEFEKQLRRSAEKPVAKPVAPAAKPVQSRSIYKTESRKDSTETLFSSNNKPLEKEYISYDTVDDISKLRVKKQIKESVFKKQTTLRTAEPNGIEDDSYEALPEIAFDNIHEVKKAFIYTEIFNRKYS